MTNKEVILIGRINVGKQPIGGETAKNQSLVKELKKYCSVYALDFYQNRKRPWIFIQALYTLLFHPSAALILSTTASNVYKLIQILHLFNSKRVIVHWIIGGVFDKLVKERKFKVSCFNSITCNLAESRLMVNNLNTCGIKNAFYVPNFRQIEYFPNINSRLDYLKKQSLYHFVYVSRIMESKGVDILLNAVDILNQKGLGNNFNVDFYGNMDDDYSSGFLHKIKSLDNVSYRGFLNLQEKEGYDLLAKYHFLIFPTHHPSEGFAGALIDSFIAGVPVIASDWGHNPEIIDDNRTGFLFQAKDANALAHILEKIILGKTEVDSLSINAQKEALLFEAGHVISEQLLKQIHIL